MLELAVLILSIGSVAINFYLIKHLNIVVSVDIPELPISTETIELSTDFVALEEASPPIKSDDDSRHAWRNGKIETEPVKVGWRPKNQPPPPPKPMERPSGFPR